MDFNCYFCHIMESLVESACFVLPNLLIFPPLQPVQPAPTLSAQEVETGDAQILVTVSGETPPTPHVRS